MIHGHFFHFTEEATLQNNVSTSSSKCISVKPCKDLDILESYPYSKPWVPLSGQQGRYFSQTPFEEAGETFSWGLEIQNVLTLVWQPELQTILYMKHNHYTAQRLQFWIYHTFFPMSLEFNHVYHYLHVGAVETDGKTLFFSAPSFGGKSTLTDYFIQQGATLISDDALGIEKRENAYHAVPAYPFHRPYREPEVLGYKVEKFAQEAKAVYAVFLLKQVDPTEPVHISRVKGIEKFKALHHAVFIEFPFRKKERFDFFSKMAQSVPVYEVSIPWDLNRLDEVYRAITKI